MPDPKYTGLTGLAIQDETLPHGRYLICNATELRQHTESGGRLVRVLETEDVFATERHRIKCETCGDDNVGTRGTNQFQCWRCNKTFLLAPQPGTVLKKHTFLILVDIDHVYEELTMRAQMAEQARFQTQEAQHRSLIENKTLEARIIELSATNADLQKKLETTKESLAAARRDLGSKREQP